MVEASAPPRIAFADLLRGPAALIVVIAHLVLLYQADPALVARLTMASLPSAAPAPLAYLPAGVLSGLGPFGVALFFLVSGFVIPLTLDRYAAGPFLVARALRIFPTYLAAFAAGLTALVISSRYWAQPFAYGLGDILLNAALINDLLWRFDILTLIWTLEIEIKFYVLAALFLRHFRKPTPPFLIGTSCVFIAIQVVVSLRCGTDTLDCWLRSAPLSGFAWEGMMIVFMLVGTTFFAAYRQTLRPATAALTIAALVGLFLIGWRYSIFVSLFPATPLAYLAALAVFAVAFLSREKLRHGPVTRALSAISYPLYVVHPLIGYVAIRILTDRGLPLAAATMLALALVVALATLLHVWIEKPTMTLGKSLAGRLTRSGA